MHIEDIAAWCTIAYDYSSLQLGNPMFCYNPLENGAQLVLNGEPMRELVLPAEVTQISDIAFYSCTTLQNVTFEGTVSIGESAFRSCGALAEVIFRAGAESIGADAFRESGLEQIAIPASELGSGAFMFCRSLTDVSVAEGIEKLPGSLFSGCSVLIGAELPESLVKLGNQVFQNCSSLQTIVLPAALSEMGTNVFDGCSSLAGVTFLQAEGWSYKTYGSDEAWTPVDLSVPADNAAYLSATYASKVWARNVSQ